MSRTTKFKEATKTGLGFALVFGIAMQAGWMNPYWAGWAVAVIALPTAGEAIRKGTLRVVGTIPGCIAALVIHALAPQERWTFMLLTCGWVCVTSYLMVSRPKHSYLWTMGDQPEPGFERTPPAGNPARDERARELLGPGFERQLRQSS